MMTTDNETGDNDARLGRLKPRDTTAAMAYSRRYSRVVGKLRWVLPVIVIVGLGLLLLWPMWQANRISGVMIDNIPNLMVEQLNLNGIDEKNQPYILTADRALQAANTKNLVDLQKPKGELTLQSGAWIAAQATQGRMDQNTQKLWLGGDVEIFHDGGYRFTSQEMNIDIGKSAAWGSQPVMIQGGFGVITGSGFRLLDSGKTIVVTGPAKARLDMRQLSGSDKSKSGKPNLNHSQSR